MPLALPSSLGPFSVDPQGRIAPRPGEGLPRLLFAWRDRKLSAQLVCGDGGGSLIVSAWLGRVPSSADTQVSGRRVTSFAALRALLDTLPADWRVRLLPDHQVCLDAEVSVSWPASAVELMAALTRFLLALAPYLDLLDEDAVLEPGCAAVPGAGVAGAGMTNTWPG